MFGESSSEEEGQQQQEVEVYDFDADYNQIMEEKLEKKLSS